MVLPEPEPASVADSLARWRLVFVEPDMAESSRLPDQWLAIASSSDPGTRRRAALALWNQEFLDLIPRFAEALRTRLADVRVCLTDDCPVLVYVAASTTGEFVSWVGYDPRTFVEPEFWDHFPGPLQVFLTDVHAGFVSGDRTAFGPARPMHMQTIAQMADLPDGIPDWDEDADISSTRLLTMTSDGGVLYYCLSPDLEPGQVALVYQGDIDPQDLGVQLDKLLMARLDGW